MRERTTTTTGQANKQTNKRKNIKLRKKKLHIKVIESDFCFSQNKVEDPNYRQLPQIRKFFSFSSSSRQQNQRFETTNNHPKQHKPTNNQHKHT